MLATMGPEVRDSKALHTHLTRARDSTGNRENIWRTISQGRRSNILTFLNESCMQFTVTNPLILFLYICVLGGGGAGRRRLRRAEVQSH